MSKLLFRGLVLVLSAMVLTLTSTPSAYAAPVSLDPNYSASLLAGGLSGPANGLIFRPATNDLLVSEFLASKVSRIDATTGAVGVFASVANPSEMAINSSGQVFVKTHASGPINRFDNNGNFLGNFIPFSGLPTGITFDSLDNFYVADNPNGTIWRFVAGTFSSPTIFASGFRSLAGIAFDPSGQLFAADFKNDGRVYQVTPGATTLADHVLWADGLSNPTHFAFDPISGDVFVSDQFTIVRMSAPGVSTTFASGFDRIFDLDFDPAGNLYVDDFRTGEVWKFSPTVSAACDMGITQTNSADPVATGERFTYNLTARNYGSTPCDEVEVGDKLPKGVSDVNVSAISIAPCSITNNTATCTFGTMEPGDTAFITITVNAPIKAGIITNTAQVITTSKDSKKENNKVSETTTVIEDRKVIFIQGIDSESGNINDQDGTSNCNRIGFINDIGGNRVQWMMDYLIYTNWVNQEVPSLDSPADFFYFSYSGSYCQQGDDNDYLKPLYLPADTCNGVRDASDKLQDLVDDLISRYPHAKFDIIAHSMGGLVASYWLYLNPEMQSKVNSIIPFDSPLRGSIFRNPRSVCSVESKSWKNLLCNDLAGCPASEIIDPIASLGKNVSYYTIDATREDLPTLVEAVPGDRTTLRKSASKLHCKLFNNHSSVWEDEGIDIPRPSEAYHPVLCWINKIDHSKRPKFQADNSEAVKAVFVACGVTNIREKACTALLQSGGLQ